MTKKSGQKLLIENGKSFWCEIKFSSFFKGFQLSKIVSDFKVHLLQQYMHHCNQINLILTLMF